MIRVHDVFHDNRITPLALRSERGDKSNIFTVVIGKNGVGKSRLLSNIAKTATKESKAKYGIYGENLNHAPLVVAVSTSPFDKFPNPRRRTEPGLSNYRYVGIRGDSFYASSSAVSLISSAAKGLLSKLITNQNDADLASVFRALDFRHRAEFIFKPSFIDTQKSSYAIDGIANDSLRIELNILQRESNIYIDERYHPILERLNLADRIKTVHYIKVLQKYLVYKKALELHVDFLTNASTFDGRLSDQEDIAAILHLMNLGLIRLMDIRLEKRTYGPLSLKRASSGEQCLFLLILGIAGHIENGSLILIDEPEISLHPKWQEEFMMLLETSFYRYQNCQFIVATHSPQIISRLSHKNAFITSLSNNQLYPSQDFHNKSADFQLAELFGAPGRMNEYISRISFNLLAKLRARKSTNNEIDEDARKLFELQQDLDQDDPLFALIESIGELYNHYANN